MAPFIIDQSPPHVSRVIVRGEMFHPPQAFSEIRKTTRRFPATRLSWSCARQDDALVKAVS